MNKAVALPPRVWFTNKERRRNAELECARLCFLGMLNEKGLRLAHNLKEHDGEMRWLAELFSVGEMMVSVEVLEKRLGDWCTTHPDDARALMHLANVGRDYALMEEAAAMGDARAIAEMSSFVSWDGDKQFELAWAAAAKGDAYGTYCLMHCFRGGSGCEKNESIAKELRERASDLGSLNAFVELAEDVDVDFLQKVKLLFTFFGLYSYGTDALRSAFEEVLECQSSYGYCGEVICEVGELFKGSVDVEKGEVFGLKQDQDSVRALTRMIAMYDGWCNVAREACVAWILVSKRMAFNKDVRRMIARMAWETRREGRGTPLTK